MIEIVTDTGVTVMLNVRNITSISKASESVVIGMVDNAVWRTRTSYEDIKKIVEMVLSRY